MAVNWVASYGEAVARATAEGKPLYLDFFTPT
jgi:hypothetical protein